MYFCDFYLAGEKGHVTAAHQFVPHLDRKAGRPGVSNALLFGDAVAAATVGLPPVTLLGLLRLAVVLDPRGGAGHGELHKELAAARDRTVHPKLRLRNPAPGLEITFVGIEGECLDLYRDFCNCRLLLRETVCGEKNGEE